MDIFEIGDKAMLGAVAIATGLIAWGLMLLATRRWIATSNVSIAVGSAISTSAVLLGVLLLIVT
ncbi:MAG: hypothetical protein R3246_13840 [Acidimicrobiia bacterium]|nr:hypothetical protein [Acidimicrobiia bacterium]